MDIGGKTSYTAGFRYFFTLHSGLCRGPIDEIVEIKVGDKQAWPIPEGSEEEYVPPTPTILDDGVAEIDAYNLFGGEDGEGGVEGTLTVCMGKPDQVFPSWVKTLMGGLVPDFRGVITTVFDGLLTAVNPYPKVWEFRVRRTERGWDGDIWEPDLATIWLAGGKIKAMNPAHIIYECATNRTWGRGLPRTMLDEASFAQAAQTLFDEDFGLCLRWSRRDDLDIFVQNVCDHVGASLFTDRETGLLTMKLIRDDYNVADLPLFTKDSGLLAINDPESVSLEGAVNEIIVKYIDPISGDEREVRAQNLAAIQASGTIKPNTIEYAGIPVYSLAARVAQRDVKANTSALKRYKLELDRRAWRIYPSAPFRISVPEKGIGDIVLRAGKITEGPLNDGTIHVEAVLDVFGLGSSTFLVEPIPGWTPPPRTPTVVLRRKVREATWYDLVRAIPPAELAMIDVTAGFIATMAAKPAALALAYMISSRTGTEDFVETKTANWVPAIQLTSAIGPYDTEIAFDGGQDLGIVEPGWLLQVDDEVMLVEDITTDSAGVVGTVTVARGCVDTIPQEHASDTWAFLIEQNLGSDAIEYAPSEVVGVKLLTMTSSGKLSSAAAPIDNVEIVGRQGKPFPPANVHINGELAFGVADVAGPMTVSWAHRDRLLLADTVIGHEEGNVGPEAGTTYNLRVLDETDTVLEEQTGITGTEWFHSGAELAGDIKIELESERDTFPSFQKYVFQVAREAWLAESQALFARLTTPIVDDHKHAIDTFIYKMKLAGLWAKTTVLKPYFAGIDAQAQSQNWVQNAYHDVDVGAVTHASLSHIAGNGTNSYTKNGYAPGLNDLIVTQNSASIMTWILDNVSAASVDFGNSRTYINNRGTTDIIGARIASTGSANVSVATSAGITVASRLSATTIDLYRDGVSLGSPAVASTSPVNLEMYTGARNNAGVADQFSARQIAATGVFSGLTSADDAALVPLLQELKTAIDAL